MISMYQISDLPVQDYARILWPGGEYQITRNDVLWAARAAAHEGDHEAVLWAWTSRFVSWGHRRYDTLADLIRAHSQPVNPIWQLGGRCCPDVADDCTSPCFVTRANPTGANPRHCPCSERTLERRSIAIRLPWEQIGRALRGKVLAWATAELTNPVPKATDFSAAPCAPIDSQQRRGIKAIYTLGNCFYADRNSISWPSGYVKISLGDRVASDRSPGILFWLIAGAAGYAGWKYRKKIFR